MENGYTGEYTCRTKITQLALMQTRLDLVSLVIWLTSRMEARSLFRVLQFSRTYYNHGPISALGLVNSCVAIARSAATTTIGLEVIHERCKGARQNISVLEAQVQTVRSNPLIISSRIKAKPKALANEDNTD